LIIQKNQQNLDLVLDNFIKNDKNINFKIEQSNENLFGEKIKDLEPKNKNIVHEILNKDNILENDLTEENLNNDIKNCEEKELEKNYKIVFLFLIFLFIFNF
jgi:hypothetical protein